MATRPTASRGSTWSARRRGATSGRGAASGVTPMAGGQLGAGVGGDAAGRGPGGARRDGGTGAARARVATVGAVVAASPAERVEAVHCRPSHQRWFRSSPGSRYQPATGSVMRVAPGEVATTWSDGTARVRALRAHWRRRPGCQTRGMRLAELVAVADQVAATPARTAKRAALAGLLRSLAPHEVEPAVGLLVGEPRQGRVGVGWATVADIASSVGDPAPTLEIVDLDDALDRLQASHGPGSTAERRRILGDLLARATPAEAAFVRRLLGGELRQGALEGVMADAVAEAAAVPATLVRRAAMLSGDLRRTASIALTRGPGRPRGGRAHPVPTGATHAGVHRRGRGRRHGWRRDRLGRVEARRRPHPGAPARRPGRDLHPQPQPGDRPSARGGAGGARAPGRRARARRRGPGARR